eukprot:Rmarinus@m.22870
MGSSGMSKISFTSLRSTLSAVGVVGYTLSSLGDDFASNVEVASLSLSPSVDCDVDFTLSVYSVTVEENGKDEMSSAFASIGGRVCAISDEPHITTLPDNFATEDLSFCQ